MAPFRPRYRIAAGLAVLVCAATTWAAESEAPVFLALRSGTVTYTVVHKLHKVKGTSRALDGLVKLQKDRPTLVEVRARVASFDSGNSNRDEHMREATHEPVHPWVTVKGVLPPLAPPIEAQKLTLDGTVELNGIRRKTSVPISLTPEGRGTRARFSFPFSLTAFQIERPELLLIKVEDEAAIEGDLLFEARE